MPRGSSSPSPQICFAAGDARPYAFGVLATTGALWMLVRWIERGRAADALAYALLVSAAVYFQFLFAAMLPVHACYAIRRSRDRGAPSEPRSWRSWPPESPSSPRPRAGSRARSRATARCTRSSRCRAPLLSRGCSCPAESSRPLIASLLVWWAFASARRLRPVPVWTKPPAARSSLWLLVPVGHRARARPLRPVAGDGTSVFVPRYMMCVIPAQALLIAWLLRGVQPASGRTAVLAGYLVILLLARGLKVAHTNEDWRGATAAVRAANGARPVLLSGTYTESRNLDWVAGPEARGVHGRAAHYYPAGGPTTVLPLFVGQDAEGVREPDPRGARVARTASRWSSAPRSSRRGRRGSSRAGLSARKIWTRATRAPGSSSARPSRSRPRWPANHES